MASKSEALKVNGRLKKGYYYGKGGAIRKAKTKTKTKLYTCAKKLGSAGGKVTAKKRRQPGLW